MKKIILTLATVLASYSTYAQTNTFPSSGNVGIGTTSPVSKFNVISNETTDAQSQSGLRIDDNASSPVVALLAGVSNANNVGYIQTVQPNVSWSARSLALQPNGGNIGIGTNSPSTALQIGDLTGGEKQLSIPGTYNFEQVRLGQIGNGNSALEFVNHNGGAASYGIKLLVDVDHGAPGLQFQYAQSASSYSLLSYSTGLYMNLIGYVGIGTTNPDAKLAVNGTIHSKEVKVDLTGWPDYVFKPTYVLPSLLEVKSYIDQNQHLPEMPSEQEVKDNGINLGEMNKVLVKKVEELTLYLIDKDKQLTDQHEQIEQLKQKELKDNQSQHEQINHLKEQLVALTKALTKN